MGQLMVRGGEDILQPEAILGTGRFRRSPAWLRWGSRMTGPRRPCRMPKPSV